MLRIVCIGAGRLAGHLMPQLEQAGHRVIQVYSRTRAHAETLASTLTAAEVPDSLRHVDPDADLYFLTVPDDAIPDVSRVLASRIHGGIIVHCSGVAPLEVLAEAARRGIFYPLQSFSPGRAIAWREVPIFVTADDPAIRETLLGLGRQVSGQVFGLDEKQKAWLHVAAVFANNFSNHTLALAEHICASAGISFDWLKPLIRLTFEKALDAGPEESQTGPAVRNDVNTIQQHIELLRQHPEWQQLYALLTESIREMAHRSGRTPG
jgi:predicted short-subunit dehydrogenase-like oxidoreductase (DUF2520 family)